MCCDYSLEINVIQAYIHKQTYHFLVEYRMSENVYNDRYFGEIIGYSALIKSKIMSLISFKLLAKKSQN